MSAVFGLPAPGWAVEHHENDASIRWSRGVDLKAEPIFLDDEPVVVKVEAYIYDRLEVLNGRVTLTREDEPSFIVGNEMMTLAQARLFGDAIMSVVEAVSRPERGLNRAFPDEKSSPSKGTLVPAPPCPSWCTRQHEHPSGWSFAGGGISKQCEVVIPAGVEDEDGDTVEVRLVRFADIEDGAITIEAPVIRDLCPGTLTADAAVALAGALRQAAELART